MNGDSSRVLRNTSGIGNLNSDGSPDGEVDGPSESGSRSLGESLQSNGTRLISWDDGRKVRGNSTAPGELDGLTLNQSSWSDNSKLSRNEGNRGSDESERFGEHFRFG